MKRLLILFAVVLVVFVSLYGCNSEEQKTLTVFGSAGAKPAVDEICLKFQEQYTTKVEVTYGGGGEVLNQMILSQSGDVYIAPEQRFMDTARDKQAIDADTIKSIAYMVPVIAVQKGNPKNIMALADLARPGVRVAITRAETTLLGRYAPEIFSKAGLAEAIGKNIVTEAARPDSLLTMLVMGQVDAGIIWHFYQNQAPEQIDVVFLSPEQLTGIGEMQIAVSLYSESGGSARQFIDFITSAEGKAIFQKEGYIVDAQELKKYWH
jgi:molybdate transport system substrate-binding protein